MARLASPSATNDRRAVDIGGHRFRVAREVFVIVGERRLEVADDFIGPPALPVNLVILGIELLRRGEIGERVYVLAEIDVTDAAPFVRLRQARIEPQRFGEVVDRALVVVQPLIENRGRHKPIGSRSRAR